MDGAIRLDQPELDPGQLLMRVIDGSASAWQTLIDRYERHVRYSLRGFRFDDATTDDVMQVVWMKLYEHAATIRNPDCLAGWLRTTARRAAILVTRQRARALPVDGFHENAIAVWDEPDLRLPRERTAVLRALERLTPGKQQLLRLLFGDDELSYDQIASILGRPAGSVGPTRSRALDQLRTEYEIEMSRMRAIRATM